LELLKLASRLGAAPSKQSFGDSAALLVPGLYEKLVRLPGVAPGHPPWRGDILLLNHSRRKVKGPGTFLLPAHAISTKNKHLLVIYSIPTRGFTAAVSVFRGTPPAKPFDCKIRTGSSGAPCGDRGADPTGGEPRLSRAFLCFVPGDII
jgi:hypothetical protein